MKRIYLYYASKFFFDFTIIYPLYSIIFRSRGQDEGAIGWLLAIWSLSVIVFELPMGVVSDRMKRKNVLLWAVLAKSAAFALWIPESRIPESGFILSAAGFILWGLSSALASGTEEAWLFEALHEKGLQDRYAMIRGRGSFFSALGVSLASPIGGYVSGFGITPVLAVSIATTFLSGLFILGFGNPPRTAPRESGNEAEPQWKKDILPALREIVHKRRVLIMMTFSGAVLVTAGVLDEWDPLFLSDAGLSTVWIGFWLTIRFLSESAGAAAAHRAETVLKKPSCMFAAAGLFALVVVSFGWFGNLWFLVPYALFYLVYSLLSVLAESSIQHEMRGDHRATVLSFRSLLENAVGIILILITGYTARSIGMTGAWIFSGLYACSFSIMLMCVYKRVKKTRNDYSR
jgi:MFS family permease